MKPKTKKVYVSGDGRSFDTRKECRKWEDDKLYCDPVHLSTEQIIGLIETVFHVIFIAIPRDERAAISLYIRRELRGETNVDFYFEYLDGYDGLVRYNGSINYYRHRDVAIQLGYFDEKEDFDVSPNWRSWGHFPVKKIYHYFRSIGYFTKRKEEPEINPLFHKKGWHKIYSKDYGITPVEIIKEPAQSYEKDRGFSTDIIHLK